MDDILKFSTPLLRNENWRIREAIHYQCTTTPKKMSLWKCVKKDEDLKRNHDGLLRLFQSEDLLQKLQPMIVSENAIACKRKHGNDDSGCEDCSRGISSRSGETNRNNIGKIRHIPEIMMEVYSYLSLSDRIYKLSLVDTAFSRDKLRSGIVSATYGRGFNLHQALLELQRWAVEEMRKENIKDGVGSEVPIIQCQTVTVIPSSHVRLKVKSTSKRGEKFHMKRIAKISRMLKVAKLIDSEPLLYVRSNLKNTLVTLGKRDVWMTRHVQKFCSNEEWEQRHQQQQQIQCQSWWTNIANVETFLRRYFFDGSVNLLEQLMEDVGFQSDYEQYKKCQFWSSNEIGENEKLIWCLPDLSPGCNLLLPDHVDGDAGVPSDNSGGWKEHRFISCGRCQKFRDQSKSTVVRCRHGHQRYFCNSCYDSFLFSARDSPNSSIDITASSAIDSNVQPSIILSPELQSRSIICARCQQTTSS
mmetsp:Transcript_19423/g.39971  ORF Transcript_19423/g.39971 Transcript_19423/m.39971 type:complete len:472 (+) Transcript_19423:107-1522(+)